MRYIIQTTISTEIEASKPELKRAIAAFQDCPVGMFINSEKDLKITRLTK